MQKSALLSLVRILASATLWIASTDSKANSTEFNETHFPFNGQVR